MYNKSILFISAQRMAKFLIKDDTGDTTVSGQSTTNDSAALVTKPTSQIQPTIATDPADEYFAHKEKETVQETKDITSSQDPKTTHEITYNPKESAKDDTSWLQETQATDLPAQETSTAQDAKDSDALIPNLYIQSDKVTQGSSTDIAQKPEATNNQSPQEPVNNITKEEQKNENNDNNENGGVDLDALFADTAEQVTKPQESQDKITDKKPVEKTITKSRISQKPQGSIQRYLIAAGMLVAGAAVLFFLFKMMFPLGVNPSSNAQLPQGENTIVFDTGPTQHSIATGDQLIDTGVVELEVVESTEVEKDPGLAIQEELIETFESYAGQGEAYVTKGRAQNNNDMLKYGLFIHKKSLDALDKLALNTGMDTTEVQELIEGFDKYLAILSGTADESSAKAQDAEQDGQSAPSSGDEQFGFPS